MTKGNILVVDDDRDFIEFVKIILESAGYSVFTAEDAEKGFELVQRVRPDVALIDVMMSYILDGLNLVLTMRTDPNYHNIPIVLISAIISADDTGLLPSGQRLNCEAFMSKPIEPTALLRTVAELVATSATEKGCNGNQVSAGDSSD